MNYNSIPIWCSYGCVVIGKDEIFVNLSTNLRSFMEANRLNASDVARRTGLSARTVLNILKLEKAPKITTLDDIAKGLKISVFDLVRSPNESPVDYELSLLDKEHLKLIEPLSEAEREEVERYAQYLIDKRTG